MKETITSTQNPLVKQIKRLSDKATHRREAQLFVVEGVRECSLLQQSNFEIETLIVCEAIYKASAQYPIAFTQNVKYVSQNVYETIAYRNGSEGVMALAKVKTLSLQNIHLPHLPLVLVIAEVEKPGNLGAMLRTADAAQVDLVIVSDEKTDIFNPNVIRSSLGTFFTNNIATASWIHTKNFLAKHHIKSFAAYLEASNHCFESDFKQGTAIVVGSEAHGLSEQIATECDSYLKIPMLGKIDSLNVSVSAAILLYEAVRQRKFQTD